MKQTKHYQGAYRNEINNCNAEDAKFRSREIDNTGWLQQCIAKDYMKPGNLYLISDIPHHDQQTPDRALSFIGCDMLWMLENW